MSKLDTVLGNADTLDTTEVIDVVDSVDSVDEPEEITPDVKPEPEPEPEKSKKGRGNKSAKSAKPAEPAEPAELAEPVQAVDADLDKTPATKPAEPESATDEPNDICVPKKINLKSAIAIYQTPRAGAGIGYTDGPVYVISKMPTATGFVLAKCIVRGVGPLQCFVSVLDLGKNKQTKD